MYYSTESDVLRDDLDDLEPRDYVSPTYLEIFPFSDGSNDYLCIRAVIVWMWHVHSDGFPRIIPS